MTSKYKFTGNKTLKAKYRGGTISTASILANYTTQNKEKDHAPVHDTSITGTYSYRDITAVFKNGDYVLNIKDVSNTIYKYSPCKIKSVDKHKHEATVTYSQPSKSPIIGTTSFNNLLLLTESQYLARLSLDLAKNTIVINKKTGEIGYIQSNNGDVYTLTFMNTVMGATADAAKTAAKNAAAATKTDTKATKTVAAADKTAKTAAETAKTAVAAAETAKTVAAAKTIMQFIWPSSTPNYIPVKIDFYDTHNVKFLNQDLTMNEKGDQEKYTNIPNTFLSNKLDFCPNYKQNPNIYWIGKSDVVPIYTEGTYEQDDKKRAKLYFKVSEIKHPQPVVVNTTQIASIQAKIKGLPDTERVKFANITTELGKPLNKLTLTNLNNQTGKILQELEL